MQGQYKGVQRLFRDICPNIVVLGCTCHSLRLCASTAAKKLLNSVERLAKDICSYFSNSAKRVSELEQCQIFTEEKPSRLLYPSQTR